MCNVILQNEYQQTLKIGNTASQPDDNNKILITKKVFKKWHIYNNIQCLWQSTDLRYQLANLEITNASQPCKKKKKKVGEMREKKKRHAADKKDNSWKKIFNCCKKVLLT